MGENSKIEWCDHTFNPWRGCTKVSAGCANCYAETMSKRFPDRLGIWGDNGTRIIASESMWHEPVKWNKNAAREGRMRKVFCASLTDICEDRPELEAPRDRLRRLIDETPWLTWLLLTKRPENYERFFPGAIENVWKGTSVENQETTDARLFHLCGTAARLRFISYEPALDAINLVEAIKRAVNLAIQTQTPPPPWSQLSSLAILPGPTASITDHHAMRKFGELIGWVIYGGESGPRARQNRIEWGYQVRDQCKATGVPFFCKQLGAFVTTDNANCQDWPDDIDLMGDGRHVASARPALKSSKGNDPAEWPHDLRIRDFPNWHQHTGDTV